MSEMNGFSRRMVNWRTESRARRSISRLEGHLELSPTSEVLELGSGGGGMIALLYEKFHPARMVGTDYDPDQVKAATDFLTARWGSMPAGVTLQPADAFALPFPDRSFDAVFAMMMLHHVEERPTQFERRPQALKEILRVLRPGGRIVYSEIFRRAEIRATLSQLGFTERFVRQGWRQDLAIFEAPR